MLTGLGDTFSAITNVATVVSFIPGPVGMIASGVAVTGNLAQGKWGEAALAATGLIGMGALTKMAAKAVDAGKAGAFLGGVNKAAGWLARAQSRIPGIGIGSKLFGNIRKSPIGGA